MRPIEIPAWPGLGPRLWLPAPPTAPLPFPLQAPRTLAFHVARYAIYQLFGALGFGDGASVLVPAYHHGNEVKALRAAGARVRFYSIGLDLHRLDD